MARLRDITPTRSPTGSSLFLQAGLVQRLIAVPRRQELTGKGDGRPADGQNDATPTKLNKPLHQRGVGRLLRLH